MILVLFDQETRRTAGSLAQHDSPAGFCLLEDLRRGTTNGKQRQMVIITDLEMLLQSLQGFFHETGVVHADRDSHGGGLDERHFEAMPMDNIEYLTETLLQHKAEILRPHGNENLILPPYIHRYIDRPYTIFRDTRTGGIRVAEGLYK